MQFKTLTALVALALAVHANAAALIRRGDYAPAVPPPELVPGYQPGVPGKTSPPLTPDYSGQGQGSTWTDSPVPPVPVQGGPNEYLPPSPTGIEIPPVKGGIPKYTPPPPNDIQPPPVKGGIPKYTPPPPIDIDTPPFTGGLPKDKLASPIYVDIPNYSQPPPDKETGYGAPPPPYDTPVTYPKDQPGYVPVPEIAKTKDFGGSVY